MSIGDITTGMGMNRTRKAAVAAIMLALGFAGSVAAGPFEDGVVAYEKGDYSTALRLFRPLAEQGDAAAQYNLGLMYASGRGVPQDYASAHMWLNLAAVNGDKDAVKARDMVAAHMTPAQIAKAQKLAREWRPTTMGPAAKAGP